MKTSFYTPSELEDIGLKSFGQNVLISRKASIYSPEKISIGNNVRIDDFCILSGRISIGNYIHIAAYCALYAGDTGIIMKDFSGLSSRCVIYAMTDDFTGEALLGPTVPDEFRKITAGKVTLGKYASIASGCTILPGVTIGEGSAVGAMSLINKPLPEWGFFLGIPCTYIKERSKELIKLAEKLTN